MQLEERPIRQSMVALAWSTWSQVAAEIRSCGDWWLRILALMSLTVGLGGLCAVAVLVALAGIGAPVGLVVLGTVAGFGLVTAAWVAAWLTAPQELAGQRG